MALKILNVRHGSTESLKIVQNLLSMLIKMILCEKGK